MKYTPAQVKKAIIAVVGFVLTVVSAALAVPGLVPVEALPYINGFIAVCASYGVYAAKNAKVDERPEVLLD